MNYNKIMEYVNLIAGVALGSLFTKNIMLGLIICIFSSIILSVISDYIYNNFIVKRIMNNLSEKAKQYSKLHETLVKLISQYEKKPNMFLKIRIKLVKRKLLKIDRSIPRQSDRQTGNYKSTFSIDYKTGEKAISNGLNGLK